MSFSGFKVGDKVRLSHPITNHELGIVVGFCEEGGILILVELLCGGVGHDGHGYIILGDDGSPIDIPESNRYYYFSTEEMENLGSTL